jgi:uncharacterized protein YjbI with pentapeptide repeats
MCDYEARYYDYEKGNWILYKCPHEPPQPRCMFHDGYSYKSRPNDVRNEFYKMVDDAIQNNQPLYCIGFRLPYITVRGKEFVKPVYFSDAKFQQQANFSGAIFQQADFSGAIFQQQANFFRTTFQQQANFLYATFQQQANFSGAIFQQQADFSGAIFQQQANFLYATFQQQANFSDATFQQQANFSGAIFQQADFSGAIFQQADFLRTTFQQQANFSRAIFQQADFSGAIFQQQANFLYATFQQQANFFRTTFQQQANFFRTTFQQQADFFSATFQQQADFLYATFQQADFSYANFIGEVEFIYTTFPNEDRTNKHIPIRFDYSTFRSRVRFIGNSDELLDLSNVSFKGVNLDNVEFHNVRWREDKVLWFLPFIKRNIIVDELFMDELKNYQEVSRIYNQLRKNYEMHLHFTEASHFFIGEMEAIRRSLWSKGIGGKLASIPYLLYKYIALYGESVFLPLVFWTPVIITGFAVWRMLVSNCYDPQPQCMIDRVIDSIAAYFQVPRNTLQPTAQDIIERILAVPILGSAFIALRRRFERRK